MVASRYGRRARSSIVGDTPAETHIVKHFQCEDNVDVMLGFRMSKNGSETLPYNRNRVVM